MLLAVALPVSAQLKEYADRNDGKPGISLTEATVKATSGISLRNLPVAERKPMFGRNFATPQGVAKPSAGICKSILPKDKAFNLELWGSLIFIDTSNGAPEDGRTLGVVSFSTAGDFATLMPGVGANGGGAFHDGVYYCVKKIIREWNGINIDFVALFTHNMNTWEQISMEEVGHEMIATDVTWDPVTDNMYGCFYSEDLTKFQFGIIDYKNKTRSTICDLPVAINAIAADKDGTLYAVDLDGYFCTIDKLTGAKHIIGHTGFVPYYVTSGAIDKRTGLFYWTVSPIGGNSFLCSIDMTTGKATKLYEFPYNEEISTMYVPVPDAEDEAPAAVENVEFTFLRGSLSGTVSFTMPSTLFCGDAAQGEAGYVVLLNGSKIADAKAAYGSHVSLDVTAEQAGAAKFVIYAYNEAGESPRVRSELFLGKGTPKSPENVVLLNNEGNMKLSWLPVTESVDGGYIDVENMTYNVIRYPGGVVVASGIAETSFEETVEIPYDYTIYYYNVEAVSEGMTSAPTSSNSSAMGGIHPPYSCDFSSSSLFAGWTIVDANNDNITWKNKPGELSISTNFDYGMDDWCFSPGVELQPDKLYRIDIEMRGSIDGCPERVEIYYGTKPEAREMQYMALDTVTIGSTQPITLSGYMSNDEIATMHIGLHAVSEAYTGGFSITRFSISEGTGFDVSNRVSDIELNRSFGTTPIVEISFKAPDSQADGEDLTSLTKIEVSRNDSGVVKVIESPTPGSSISFTDPLPCNGLYTYTFTPYSDKGEGAKAYAAISVAAGTPSTPTKLVAEETSDLGKVKLSWDAVTTDTEGYPLENNSVAYALAQINGGQQDLVADNLKVTSYTYRAVPRGEQAFKQYAVSAYTLTAESGQKISELLAVGAPYSFPYSESLYGTRNKSIVASTTISGDGAWQIANDASFSSATSYDHDNGYFVMVGSNTGDEAQLRFGKVSLVGAAKPVVSFYSYNINGSAPDYNQISVLIKSNGEWITESTIMEIEAANEQPGWHRTVVDLSAYEGQTIELALVGAIVNYQYILVDAVSICNGFDNDVTATEIIVPERVKPGKDFQITAKATNFGVNDAQDVSVALLRNGTTLQTTTIEKIDAGTVATVSFTESLNVSFTDGVTYDIQLTLEGDENPEDNALTSGLVAVDKLSLPMVENFTINSSETEVMLAWNEPAYEGTYTEIRETEDFESYESFTTSNLGEWTLIDGDGDNTWGVGSVEFPGIDKNQPLSYFVVDTEYYALNETWAAHSGTKYLSNIGAQNMNCDDWLISPQLNGKEQLVSFYARSYNPSFAESFEFLYSTTDIDRGSFVSLGQENYIGSDWTEYSYQLPEGAKYFAIRCISFDAFLFQIDDVTYSKFADDSNVLLGYNVYCNNVLLTPEPIAETAYTASFASPDDVFAVSAVYTAGESDVASGSVAGVELPGAGAGAVSITGHKGYCLVQGASGMNVEVVTPDGRVIYADDCDDTTSISLHRGIYIVNVNRGRIVRKIEIE